MHISVHLSVSDWGAPSFTRDENDTTGWCTSIVQEQILVVDDMEQASATNLLVVRRSVALCPSGGIPVRLPPLEALRGQLVGGEAARPRREAARDHNGFVPIPRLVVGHYPAMHQRKKKTSSRDKTTRHTSHRSTGEVHMFVMPWA